MILMKRLAFQPGFFILMWYLAWVKAELNLILLVSRISSTWPSDFTDNAAVLGRSVIA
jgi:hypothetical protein